MFTKLAALRTTGLIENSKKLVLLCWTTTHLSSSSSSRGGAQTKQQQTKQRHFVHDVVACSIVDVYVIRPDVVDFIHVSVVKTFVVFRTHSHLVCVSCVKGVLSHSVRTSDELI